MNRWNIPEWLENEVVARDKSCVYCRRRFSSKKGSGRRRSWEHIVNDARIITRENIALCCRSCNSSKGAKPLDKWIDSSYCIHRGITEKSVSSVVKRALRIPPSRKSTAAR